MRLETLSQVGTVKQGDTKTEFSFRLVDYANSPVDLTGKTVIVKIANNIGKILDKAPTVTDAVDGVIAFSFDSVDVTGYGEMRLEVHVDDGDSLQIVPSDGYYRFIISRNLDDATSGVTNYTLDYFTEKTDNAIANVNNTLNNKVIEVDEAVDAKIAEANTAISNTNAAIASANTAASAANTAATNANTKATELEDRVDAAIAAGTVDLELQDARGTYPNLGNRLNATDTQLSQANRQSQALVHGVQIVNASQDSPVNVEIQGRTLTSLGNSNLLNGKKYVLTDKKTKVKVDNAYVAGVNKFTKQTLLTSTANFLNKVSASTVENPHLAFSVNDSTTLRSPSAITTEFNSSNYSLVSSLNGSLSGWGSATVSGAIDQHLFSFDLIQEVERKLGGRIPAVDTAGKVAWIKANVNKIEANWHGFGSSPTGNKATFTVYNNVGGVWYNGTTNHTSGTVTKLTKTLVDSANINEIVDVNGFVHWLAYAEPSNGTVASTINTDFVECVIELKSTAQLDTRPQVLRVANFEGKVSASTVENPHVLKARTSNTLVPDVSAGTERSQSEIDNVKSLNGTSFGTSSSSNTFISQHQFSFDLIAEIERNIGRIPRSTVADKVQWVKDNVAKIACNWHGYGSSVGGNKATLNCWNGTQWSAYPFSHSNASVTKITWANSGAIPTYVQSDGFVHFLAYAEASDGVTASTINTDFIDLEIELKAGASFHDPLVPLYEVDDIEYGNILVTWDEANVVNRYPRVRGTQHLQNPYVMAEGENLADIRNSSALRNYSGAKIVVEEGIQCWEVAHSVIYDVVRGFAPNTRYTFKYKGKTTNGGRLGFKYTDGTSSTIVLGSAFSYVTLTSDVGKTVDNLYFTFASGGLTYISIEDFMLNIGIEAKPYVPRNPSYLFADVKLGQIGTAKDMLYKQDGQWNVRKVVEKDVVLDGSMPWAYAGDATGTKLVDFADATLPNYGDSVISVTKYDGRLLIRDDNQHVNFIKDTVRTGSGTGFVRFCISDEDTGWTETLNPTVDQIKAYFNGWKYTGNGTTHSWVSIVDGSAPTTNTIDYVKANKAPNYTPYKLSYVLATPQIVNVTDKVEGDIAVSGATQVEVGSGAIVREKVVPHNGTTHYFINDTRGTTSLFTNKSARILNVYKNGIIDSQWTLNYKDGYTNGNAKAHILPNLVDLTSEYTATYLVLDRHLFSNNATEVKAAYDSSLKSVVDTLIARNADQETAIGVNVRAIAELYKRVKALGG